MAKIRMTMDALQLANTAFAVDMFKKLCEKDKTANIIFSPLCTSTSLALAYKATKGDTAEQMKQVLHLQDVKDVSFGFQTITSDVSKLSSFFALKMVKRLFVDKSLNPTTDFVNSTKRPFPSELELVEFKEKTEETREKINKSLSELTDGKMENVLNEDSVSDQTQILLVNAAYFVTNWMKKFPEAEIKECPFKVNKTETKPVQMMNLEATFCLGYVKDLNVAILELPCLNKHISMLILLPKEIEDETTGLEKLEKALTPETLLQWTNPSMMANTKVNVFLPKFSVEGDYDLKPLLESLGMTNIFNESASDFSEMCETKGVVVSKIIHKVSLEVNEQGGDSREVPGYRILQHKDEFKADHPFIFLFRHNKTRNPKRGNVSMWYDSSPLYLDTLWWPRVLYQTLPASTEEVNMFCSIATTVQAGIRICICETAATLRPTDARGKNHGDTSCTKYFHSFVLPLSSLFMMDSISRPVTEFCLDLYKKLNRSAEDTNIVFSPMSISVALALIHLGAKNNTAAQIEKVLHVRKAAGRMSLGSDHESAAPEAEPEGSLESQPSFSQCNKEGDLNHKVFQELLLQLQNLGENYVLTLANNLFIQQGFELQQQFLMCSKELYGAMLQTVNFHGAVEAARRKINAWVESETQGKIKELFAPGVIDGHALLVLVNVIYFKASWEHKFEEEKTVQRDFKLNQNRKKPVQMMYQKGKFKLGYIEEVGAQILELPYAQKSLSMIILLPGDAADGSVSGLEQIESTITHENLMLWTSSENMFETTVEVYLPRFKLEGTFNLNEVLQEMGMTDIFTESKVDLSAMTFAKSLVLSNVVHKAYVEVNEEGTVAAAGTGASIVRRSLPLTEVFMANHPFLFFIRHNPTSTIIFFGKLCSP
ncbi:Serpin B5 [Lonchura striata]|uniref:Serpin B5 n=1 Tax=Lonchura striata TaxID=40157 RepID=A0A218UP19_9PASE|nr:Serpin B5 [Lonchura striata domestica]